MINMIKENKHIVGIRADGNSAIGMGHLMRCVSIAKALQKAEVECVFITASEEAGIYVEKQGLDCRILHTNYRDMESEIPLIKALAEEENLSLLLVDSYQLTQKYVDEWKKYCPVFYMDDTGVSLYQADGIINYNIYGKELGYEARCDKETTLLLGAGYAPVKEMFANTSYQVREKVSRILITMGGSDAWNIAGLLAEKMLETLPYPIELDVICGRFNPHLEVLQKLRESDDRVHVLVDVPDMWNKMAAADIVVSAAGSTLYELCTMGVPTVCCYYVENQRRAAEGFANRVQMKNAGDFSADAESVLENMTQEVLRLIHSREERFALSQRMKQVTDGHGAEHLAAAVKNYLEKQISK